MNERKFYSPEEKSFIIFLITTQLNPFLTKKSLFFLFASRLANFSHLYFFFSNKSLAALTSSTSLLSKTSSIVSFLIPLALNSSFNILFDFGLKRSLCSTHHLANSSSSINSRCFSLLKRSSCKLLWTLFLFIQPLTSDSLLGLRVANLRSLSKF